MITLGGTRTPNLRFRRPTPYPLGHEGLLRKLRRIFERNSIICRSQCWAYWILEIIDQIVQKLLLTATRIIILETLCYAASKCTLQICTNKLLWNYNKNVVIWNFILWIVVYYNLLYFWGNDFGISKCVQGVPGLILATSMMFHSKFYNRFVVILSKYKNP